MSNINGTQANQHVNMRPQFHSGCPEIQNVNVIHNGTIKYGFEAEGHRKKSCVFVLQFI